MARENEHLNWKNQLFEPDMDPRQLPAFEGLIRIWQSKRDGRRVPSWSDFDFFDFEGWHGYINVFDVSYDPFDYRTRLAGTAIEEMYGRTLNNFTREDFLQYYADEEEADPVSEHICRNLLILYSQGPLNFHGRDFITVDYIELPLSDDGERAQNTIESILPRPSD